MKWKKTEWTKGYSDVVLRLTGHKDTCPKLPAIKVCTRWPSSERERERGGVKERERERGSEREMKRDGERGSERERE